MGPGAYLRDRAAPLLVGALSLAFVALALVAHGVEPSLVTFVCVTLGVAVLVALAMDYAHRRGFYRELTQTIDALDESYLATELLERPGPTEAQLFYDALSHASRDMRGRVADSRHRQRAYREYVETWVHEIKTPIAAARLVAHNNPSPACESIDEELDVIEGYVEQALYYARSTSLDRDFQIREVDLGEAVRDAVRHKARTLIAAGVTPELASLDFTVRADPKWLSFVVGQVLANAAKYRRPGAGAAHVRISATRRKTGLDAWETQLRLADDGIGIPAADVGRVFDKGFTGENGRRFARSTGIGLYLVRELCEKMDLEVWLESAEGRGTTVFIGFPESETHRPR
ncbi:sensor histidine kinase [Thermophilibacter immobilis]|jgi:signal transduction histidine kinase|uniref:histidine kinase n=1 Tax=Thermophilibacter immobilis TaxID=2779519 RepID=A0A7S7RU39_9ACTN|nr:sensor histidine kinase [Thermophilibacter immobilis]QOY60198.1 sensor histidine kinase [Thermophilibacter immobilis]